MAIIHFQRDLHGSNRGAQLFILILLDLPVDRALNTDPGSFELLGEQGDCGQDFSLAPPPRTVTARFDVEHRFSFSDNREEKRRDPGRLID
ncbi:hypothetical protein D3C86_800430 [compost metagenome]